jgi:hypothetical protein
MATLDHDVQPVAYCSTKTTGWKKAEPAPIEAWGDMESVSQRRGNVALPGWDSWSIIASEPWMLLEGSAGCARSPRPGWPNPGWPTRPLRGLGQPGSRRASQLDCLVPDDRGSWRCGGEAMIFELHVQTRAQRELQDITSQVQRVVSDCGVEGGTCHVCVPHTTAGLTLNENWDPDVQGDLVRWKYWCPIFGIGIVRATRRPT